MILGLERYDTTHGMQTDFGLAMALVVSIPQDVEAYV